jgi:hypothetical protein
VKRWPRAERPKPAAVPPGVRGGTSTSNDAWARGSPVAKTREPLDVHHDNKPDGGRSAYELELDRPTLDLIRLARERERIIEAEVAAGRMESPGPEVGPFGVAGVDWFV